MNGQRSVVILGHSAKMSGAEIAMLRLLPELRDVDVRVILAEGGDLVDALRQAGIAVEVLPLPAEVAAYTRKNSPVGMVKNLWAFGRYCFALARLLEVHRAEVVHTNSMKAHVYGGIAGRLAGRKVVWHVRDRLASDYLSPVACFLMRWMVRLLPHHVITNSLATSQTVPARRMTVVHDSQPYLSKEPAAQIEVRPTIERIGIVGRISPWKGQHIFLDAVAMSVVGRSTEIRLIGDSLFGEEAYHRRIQEIAARHFRPGQVDFRGFRADVEAELEELDLVVHASTVAEPFGQVVVEAMAVGVPVIAADAGGPAEIVTHGVDGLLVQPNNPPALARAIDSLADPDFRHRMASAARRRALQFTPTITASRVLEVYDEVLS